MGAPAGNRNASRSRDFRDALRWALENYSDRDEALKKMLPSKRPLFEIALGIVEAALRKTPEISDPEVLDKLLANGIQAWKFAVDTLGDRLDGKPVQGVDIGVDPEGNDTPAKLTIEFITAAAAKNENPDSGGV